MKPSVQLRSQSGFTLLEVILAVTILASLSILTTQAISRALKSRTKIQAEVDDVSALRDAIRMIRTDINMAFHHRDFEKEINDLANKPATTQRQNPAAPGVPPTPPAGQQATNQPQRQTKREDPTTQFVGADTQLDFVTMNTGRLSSSTLQADFIEVGYSVKNCNNLSTGTSSPCLYRRTQNILDDDVKTGGNDMVMLENVTEFKMRYIGEGKQDWVSTWSSAPNSPDAGTRGKFPDAVEVSLSIEREIDKKQRTFSMQLVIPLHFPNNPPARTGTSANTGNSSGNMLPDTGDGFEQ
ncbi:type II secretion system protein GspJ [Pseudobdellovibrio exovorus]|uniref:Type II secretion system protein J n=1 Tax=Pseudobdellovibrio exovorus JSS TaxID=1184267 RepID=M4V945_9BACT|nr:type II secretion system protein GspJ [Pseudobdellovibrio exovorus]AGH95743.1 putative general secretion pathway protein J precursor [Pseudobdellovibrio exovorus JSS]